MKVGQSHHNTVFYYAFQALSGLHFIIKVYPQWLHDPASGILGLKNFFTWIINFEGLRKNTFSRNMIVTRNVIDKRTNLPVDLFSSEDFYRIYFPNNQVTLAR